jgi:hypothetical protein
MPQREVEISISKTGEVKVHMKGYKGKACTKLGQFLAQVVGQVKSQQFTSEYYEPEEKAAIRIEQKQSR